MATDHRPSIAALQTLSSQPRWEEDDVTQAATALPVLLEIAAAALVESEAECTTQAPHWDYVEGGSENSLCFMDIHCPSCPVSVARAKFDAALDKVRE